jgi:hypothetical protein
MDLQQQQPVPPMVFMGPGCTQRKKKREHHPLPFCILLHPIMTTDRVSHLMDQEIMKRYELI